MSEHRCVKCAVLFFQGILVGSWMEKRNWRHAFKYLPFLGAGWVGGIAYRWKTFGAGINVYSAEQRVSKGAFDFTSSFNKPTSKTWTDHNHANDM